MTQTYLRMREATHRYTAEFMNERVQVWGVHLHLWCSCSWAYYRVFGHVWIAWREPPRFFSPATNSYQLLVPRWHALQVVSGAEALVLVILSIFQVRPLLYSNPFASVFSFFCLAAFREVRCVLFLNCEYNDRRKKILNCTERSGAKSTAFLSGQGARSFCCLAAFRVENMRKCQPHTSPDTAMPSELHFTDGYT